MSKNKLPNGAKEISPIRAYLMEGELDSDPESNGILIQYNGKFYDMTGCSDEDVVKWMKEVKHEQPTQR